MLFEARKGLMMVQSDLLKQAGPDLSDLLPFNPDCSGASGELETFPLPSRPNACPRESPLDPAMSPTAGCGFSLLWSAGRLRLAPGEMSRLGSKTLSLTDFPPVSVCVAP